MTEAEVARFIGLTTECDHPITLDALRRELAQKWPGDHDAEVLEKVILSKIRRLRGSN